MPRVMLLIPSASYRAQDFMLAAAELGVEVVVGSDRSNPLETLHPERHVGLDFADPDRGMRQIEEYERRYPLDAIVAVDDAGLRLAARASRRLELPHNPVAAVDATRNKALLREHLAQAGLPSPPYRVVPIDALAAEAAVNVTFPVVVKPLALSASRGVIRANNVEEFVAAFERVKLVLDRPECRAELGNTADRLLIEGYIPGIEVSVEGLLTDGQFHLLAIFDKPDPLEGPYFAETIYTTPSRLLATDQTLIIETTMRAAAAIGLNNGPIHAELRLNDSGAYLIDMAARSIGGLCSRTLSFGTGMSLEEIILRHAIGAGVPSFERESNASGVMMIPIPKRGILRAIDGLAEAAALPEIESVTMTIHVGAEVVPLPEGGEYLGFIFARGDTPAVVEDVLRQAHGRLRFDIG